MPRNLPNESSFTVPDPRPSKQVIFLIGAGASGFLGLHTLDTMLREPNTPLSKIVRDTASVIASHRVANAIFEELIARLKFYLKTAETVRQDPLFKREFGQVPSDVEFGHLEAKWKAALTECYRLLIAEYGPSRIDVNSSQFMAYAELLRTVSQLNMGTVHVFTTNYDCTYQVLAANSTRIRLFSHIDNENGSFEDRWFPANPLVTDASLPAVFVHRLHGCIAWFSDDRQPFRLEEVFGAGKNLEINDDDKLHRMAIKLVTSQPIGLNPGFSLAFNEFREHLRAAKALLVWGYRFRDMEVLRTINNALQTDRKPLPILYLNPYLSELQVVENIRDTLRDVPIKLASSFAPKQIPWSNGRDELLGQVVREALKPILMRKTRAKMK